MTHFGGFRFYQPVYPVLLLNLLNLTCRVAPQYVPPKVHSGFGRGWKLQHRPSL